MNSKLTQPSTPNPQNFYIRILTEVTLNNHLNILIVSIRFDTGIQQDLVITVFLFNVSETLVRSVADFNNSQFIFIPPFVKYEEIIFPVNVAFDGCVYPEIIFICRFFSYAGSMASVDLVIKTGPVGRVEAA
jgi:hypothetical protein